MYVEETGLIRRKDPYPMSTTTVGLSLSLDTLYPCVVLQSDRNPLPDEGLRVSTRTEWVTEAAITQSPGGRRPLSTFPKSRTFLCLQ